MEEKIVQFHGRQRELRQLYEFFEEKKSSFCFVRGRRRIGKSYLLSKFCENRSSIFRFDGKHNESDRVVRARWADEWDEFTGEKFLSIIAKRELSWRRIFTAIVKFLVENKTLLMVIDEIQWIHSSRNGFSGYIKELWDKHHERGNIKIIICGSSTRFFLENVDSENATLRGLQSRSSLWVPPFSPAEMKKYFFPHINWSNEEFALLYMMTGGTSWYLSLAQRKASDNFIRTINDIFFRSDTVFLEEIDTILKTEYRQRPIINEVKIVLSHLTGNGTTMTSLSRRTGFGISRVHNILAFLENIGLIKPRSLWNDKKRKNRSSVRYYINDFFVRFYFSVLAVHAYKIERNDRGMLFGNVIVDSKKGYYISGFTGESFEMFILRSLDRSPRTLINYNNHKLLSVLEIDENLDYDIDEFFLPNKTQVDILVSSQDDRETRIIEAKWVSEENMNINKFIDQIKRKSIPPKYKRQKFFLAVPQIRSSRQIEKLRNEGIGIITLEHLF